MISRSRRLKPSFPDLSLPERPMPKNWHRETHLSIANKNHGENVMDVGHAFSPEQILQSYSAACRKPGSISAAPVFCARVPNQ